MSDEPSPRLQILAIASVCATMLWTNLHSLRADPPSDRIPLAIDTSVEIDNEWMFAEQETPSLLLRRLSLDLRMMVPTLAELDEFQADKSEDRWSKWVDRFLEDPLHNERMVDWLDKTLMQRRPFKYVERAKWIAHLRQVVDERKPIDSVLIDMVSSVWWNATERAKQRFFLDREGDSHGLARDLGRIVYGKDMQCAQCHDHPQVADYLQIDYHGLLGFVSPGGLVEAKTKDEKGAEQKLQIYVERAAGDAPFESVFDKGVVFRTGSRIPGGTERLEAYTCPDQRYQTAALPDAFDGVPIPPALSRRQSLLNELKTPSKVFARNWANRVWALMMGRGLVHPLDMHHADNPAAHSELLELLANDLTANAFDLRSLMRSIALSQTYQRASRLRIEDKIRDGAIIDLPDDAISQWIRSTKESQVKVSDSIASQQKIVDAAQNKLEDTRTVWRTIQKERVTVRSEIDKAEAKFNEAKKKRDESTKLLSKQTKIRDDTSAKIKLLEEAHRNLEQAKILTTGDDAELAQAIATTKSKAEAAKALLPDLEKKFTEATAANDATTSALELERGPLLEVAKQLGPIDDKLKGADREFVAMREEWRQLQSQLVQLQQQLGTLSRIDAWLVASENARTAEKEAEGAKQLWIVQKNILDSLEPKLAEAKQQWDRAAAIKLAMEAKRASAHEKLQGQIAERDVLQSTIAALEKSALLVASVDAISAAKAAIQENLTARQPKFDHAQAEVAAVDRELSEQTSKVVSHATQVQQCEQQLIDQSQVCDRASMSLDQSRSVLTQSLDASAIAMQKVIADRQRSFSLSPARGLSPEQFGWSVLQATKVFENYTTVELAALEKESPMPAEATAEQKQVRRHQATRQAIDKLRGNVDVFSNLYASGVGQSSDEFFASPDQALFMANGGSVFSWSAPSGNNAAGMAIQQTDGIEAAHVLYRTIFSREPTKSEEQWISEQLTVAADKKNQVAQELVWGMLTSTEFRVYP